MPEQGAAHKRRTGRQARFGSLAGDCQQHNKGAYKWRGSGSTQVTNETCSVGESKCAHPTVEPNSVKLPQQDALLLCTYDCVSPPTQPLRRAARPVVGAGGGCPLACPKPLGQAPSGPHPGRPAPLSCRVWRCRRVAAGPGAQAKRVSSARQADRARHCCESARGACLLLPRGQAAALLRVCKVRGAVARQVEEVLHPLGALALRGALSLPASTSLSGPLLRVPACTALATSRGAAAAAWGRPVKGQSLGTQHHAAAHADLLNNTLFMCCSIQKIAAGLWY